MPTSADQNGQIEASARKLTFSNSTEQFQVSLNAPTNLAKDMTKHRTLINRSSDYLPQILEHHRER